MSGYLVFLHGKGADKSAHRDFMDKLAAAYQADLITINAPLPYKNGYSWFDKRIVGGERVVDEESFGRAADYVLKKIGELGLNSRDIILCGHSQGGAVAVAAGIKRPVRGVICICGDWPSTTEIKTSNAMPDIIWAEGGKDAYLSDERKQSYRYLQEAGANVRYICDAETEHDVFGPNLLEKIACHDFIK